MKLKFPNFNGKNYRKTITKKKAESKQIMSSKQFHKVSAIIHTAVTASALAGAFPIPMADAIPITAAQVTMVLSLGRVFSRKIAAEEFLSGKKTPTSEKDELKKLIKNIETVLDDLPDDHPLRDDFDRLAQLF